MKKLNYTGSSKLKSRIAYLLNRKAPLPLDGNDDPDWGSNGQVLSTDGNGNTTWVNQGGGDTVSWTQTQASGTKIAEIGINGTSQNVYVPTAPTVNDGTLTIQQNGTTVGTFSANQSGNTTVNLTGGGGTGGHTIEDASGTDMAAEDNLQFADAKVTDDSGNSRTKVEVIRPITESQVSGISEDGVYVVTDGQQVSINAADVAYNGGSVAGALNSQSAASGVSFDPTIKSILPNTATDCQKAIDEVCTRIGGLYVYSYTQTSLTSGFVRITPLTGFKPIFAMVTNLPTNVATRGILWDGSNYWLRLELFSGSSFSAYTTATSCNIVAGYVPA